MSYAIRAIHVPKNTYMWRVPIVQKISWDSWDIDPSRLNNMKYEDIRLLLDKDGIRRGYSKTLHVWIIADGESRTQMST